MGQILHIRTSDRAGADAIDEWIARHQLEVRSCNDAYDAVVAMLTHPEQVPDLAFVGTVGMDVEDLALIGWLRETWPHVAIVVRDPTERTGRQPGVATCQDHAALLDLLKAAPADLLQRLGRSPIAAAPRSALGGLGPATETDTGSGLSAEELDALLRGGPQ
jgi:hypothetical protein